MKTNLPVLLSIVMFSSLNRPAQGTDFSWTGAASMNWLNPANWSPQGVPGDADTAYVGGGPVLLPPVWGGTMIWSAGEVLGECIIKSNGVLAAAGGVLSWSASVTNHGLVDFRSDSTVYHDGSPGHRLVSYGTIRKSAGTTSYLLVPTDSGGSLEGQAGRLLLAGGGSIGGSVTVSNAASVELYTGPFLLSPYTIAGTGFFGVSASSVTLTGVLAAWMGWSGGIIGGNLTISGSGVLEVSGDGPRTLSGSLTNHGLVGFVGDMIVYHDDNPTNRLVSDGIIRKSVGTNITYFLPPTDSQGGLEGRTGRFLLVGGGSVGGTVTVSNAASVELYAGSFVLLPHTFGGTGFFGVNNGDVTLTGLLTSWMGWIGGGIKGDLTISNSGVLEISGTADRGWHGSVTNHGLVDFVGGDMIVSHDDNPAHRLVSDGIIRKSARTNTIAFLAPMDSLGLLQAQTGHMLLRNGGSIGGTVTVSNAASVELYAGSFVFSPHTFAGTGFFGVNNGDVTLTGLLAGWMGWVGGRIKGELTLSNSGVLEVSGVVDRNWSASVTNHGLVDFVSDMVVYHDGNPAHRLVSDGIIRKSAGANSSYFLVPTDNNGLIESYSGLLNFAGGYRQFGGATRLFNANVQVAGTLDMLGGELSGSGTFIGSVTNHGTVRPGNGAGLLTIQGNYVQRAEGGLEVEIGGLTPISQYDRLVVTGAAQLDGLIGVSLLGGFEPSVGETFRVLTASSASGALPRREGTHLLSVERKLDVAILPTAVDLVTVVETNQLPSLTVTTLSPPTLFWPREFTGWRLQTTTNLSPTTLWTEAASTGSNYLVFSTDEAKRFWRLVMP